MERVPITPSVLEWALSESGLPADAVAADIGVTATEFESWLRGDEMPAATQVRSIARRLRRQTAVFLLPRPPLEAPLRVQFRHPIGGRRGGSMSEVERRFVRRARRLQDAERWLATELGRDVQEIPQQAITSSAADVAGVWRRRLGVPLEAQVASRSGQAMLEIWQRAVEEAGVTVLRYAMGSESCRGFCLWDRRAPVIAVNDAWTEEARAFTLFHELAHLITRTDSACAAATMTPNGDALEHWCETFAAALLVPAEALTATESISRLADVAPLARRLRVSLRAVSFRLVHLGKAPWSVYEAIPGGSDARRATRPTARNDRAETRDPEFGSRTALLFVAAVARNLISTSQALDYLDIGSADLKRLATAVAA